MPTLPLGVPSLLSAITSPEAAIEILSTFLSKSSSTTVLTGAGVSVDSEFCKIQTLSILNFMQRWYSCL